MKLKDIRERLSNWARWSRSAPVRSNGSATARVCAHLRRAAAGDLSTATAVQFRIDETDAILVEQAWKTLLPRFRELLRWHYIRNARPEMICRRLAIKPRPGSIFDLELARAEAEIDRVLAMRVQRGN